MVKYTLSGYGQRGASELAPKGHYQPIRDAIRSPRVANLASNWRMHSMCRFGEGERAEGDYFSLFAITLRQ